MMEDGAHGSKGARSVLFAQFSLLTSLQHNHHTSYESKYYSHWITTRARRTGRRIPSAQHQRSTHGHHSDHDHGRYGKSGAGWDGSSRYDGERAGRYHQHSRGTFEFDRRCHGKGNAERVAYLVLVRIRTIHCPRKQDQRAVGRFGLERYRLAGVHYRTLRQHNLLLPPEREERPRNGQWRNVQFQHEQQSAGAGHTACGKHQFGHNRWSHKRDPERSRQSAFVS